MDLVEKTRAESAFVTGVSTRGAIALYKASQAQAALEGREFVIPPADIWFTKGFDLKGKGVPKWDIRPATSSEGGKNV